MFKKNNQLLVVFLSVLLVIELTGIVKMNRAFKTNPLPRIRKRKRILYDMRLMAGHSCNFKDFHLADEIMAKIEKGEIVFS